MNDLDIFYDYYGDIEDEEDEEGKESKFVSINTMEAFPKLRLMAGYICRKRIQNGENCGQCPANDSKYCVNPYYWVDYVTRLEYTYKKKKVIKYNSDYTIIRDMKNYFGEEMYEEAEEQINKEYGFVD